MPCQKKIESSPATLKISEKARKYHFLPRKSMFELRKNSTACPLNAQGLATLMAAEDPVKDHARYEHCGKQVGCQTETQGDGKSAHRAGSEQEQDDGGHDRRHVGINNGDPCMFKALIDSLRRRLTVPQLFTNALEDQDVRVHAHTNGENDAGDARQRQRSAGKAQEAEQNDQVEKQPEIGINARELVVDEHEYHDGDHAEQRCTNTGANRVRT